MDRQEQSQVLVGRAQNGDRGAFDELAKRYQGRLASLAFVRGDCNDDGVLDIADPVATSFAVFLGQFDITCDDACDANDDGLADTSDPITTLGVLFLGGTIADAGIEECAPDPTEDELECEDYPEDNC